MSKEDLKWLKSKKLELFIESYSNSARIIQIRGFSFAEQIIHDHTTNADRSLAISAAPITELPIALTARTAATGVKRGECYVKVSIRVEGTIVALLFAGYVTDAGAPVYPNGKIESSVEGPGLIRSITGTDPAAGAEISETVPARARWRLISIRFTLVTDATVVTRSVIFDLTDGTNTFFTSPASSSQAASQTQKYNFTDSGVMRSILAGVIISHLPRKPLLGAGFTIVTTTATMQAGDDYDAPQLLVEEWIEP